MEYGVAHRGLSGFPSAEGLFRIYLMARLSMPLLSTLISIVYSVTSHLNQIYTSCRSVNYVSKRLLIRTCPTSSFQLCRYFAPPTPPSLHSTHSMLRQSSEYPASSFGFWYIKCRMSKQVLFHHQSGGASFGAGGLKIGLPSTRRMATTPASSSNTSSLYRGAGWLLPTLGKLSMSLLVSQVRQIHRGMAEQAAATMQIFLPYFD